MITMLARHKVEDAARFLEGYNSADMKAVRDNGHVKNDAVYSTVEDGNDILIRHEFETLAQAQAYLENPALAEAMGSLGVLEAPNVQMFTNH